MLFAEYLDRAAREVGVNFIGGFSALVHKGMTPGDRALIRSIPQSLAVTERVCSSVNVGTTKAGLNMDVVAQAAQVGPYYSNIVKMKLPHIVSHDHSDVHFELRWMLKLNVRATSS